MVSSIVRAPAGSSPFREAFARIRIEFEVPAAFPREVEAEAQAAIARGPVFPPGASTREREDARDLAFVTIDPPGSLDLDQAFHAERRPGGYRVHYAIADVAAFVMPAGALDRESHARGVTLYLPDGRAPMLPNEVGQGAASLLPDQVRPALLWTIELDASGVTTSARLARATVRSRAALDYASVQAALDRGDADEPLALLREIGSRRRDLEAERGGISLDLPSQEVVSDGAGSYALEYDAPPPVEGWNAQVSLLAGMEAAQIMIDARVGIVRTLPVPQPDHLNRLRRIAHALGVTWQQGATWSNVVRDLDRSRPDDAAFLIQAAHVLRGAGYARLDASNTATIDAVPIHAGVAAPYAHVTAPLRRLADRYANEIVLAHCDGTEPPEWACAALDELVKTMEQSTQRSARIERAVIDAVECAVVEHRIGERFTGVVVDRNTHGVTVQLREPAIITPVAIDRALGDEVELTLVAVDPVARRVELTQ